MPHDLKADIRACSCADKFSTFKAAIQVIVQDLEQNNTDTIVSLSDTVQDALYGVSEFCGLDVRKEVDQFEFAKHKIQDGAKPDIILEGIQDVNNSIQFRVSECARQAVQAPPLPEWHLPTVEV